MALPRELRNRSKKRLRLPRVPLPKQKGGPHVSKTKKKNRYRINYCEDKE